MVAGNPDLVFEVLEDAHLLVSCQTRFNPSDAEWDLWMTAARNLERRVGSIRLLVFTAGGHPTKPQLDRLRAVNATNPPTAIVSSSLALRFLASALTFVNPTIRCFAPTDVDGAFVHIGLVPAFHEPTRKTLERLHHRLRA